jgi:hypothetical protein
MDVEANSLMASLHARNLPTSLPPYLPTRRAVGGIIKNGIYQYRIYGNVSRHEYTLRTGERPHIRYLRHVVVSAVFAQLLGKGISP